ncbi:MAG: HAD family hydrolase [Candidatus Caldatribacteriota bacterium]
MIIINQNLSAKEKIIIKAIIFDLDDTLVKTSKLYRQAREDFYQLIKKYEINSSNIEKVLNKLDEIDIKNILKYGFSRERYPISLGETYEFFAKRNHQKIDEKIRKEFEEIGWKVYQKVPELAEDVYFVLDLLVKKYTLILATLGDPTVQENKLKLTGLKKYFSKVYIMKHKNTDEYEGIIKEMKLKKQETWLVGNSVRSDLNPGLKLGLNCILIPFFAWKFEEEKPISNNFLQLNSLKEILNYL